MASFAASPSAQLRAALDSPSNLGGEKLQRLQLCTKCRFLQGAFDVSLKASFLGKTSSVKEACPCVGVRAAAHSGRYGNPRDRQRSVQGGRRQEQKREDRNVAQEVESQQNTQSSSDMQWRQVGDELIVGSCPSELHHVDLVASIGAKALITLQRQEEELPLFSWDDVCFKAMSLEIVTARVPMDDRQYHEQALVLPDAIKVVASLTATGRKVYICDESSGNRGALVVLGYLTFFKGMELSEAMDLIVSVNPQATPSVAAWEEAKNRILAGHASRVAKCAKAIEIERLQNNIPGSSADDWIMAQKQVIYHVLKEGVQTQVSIADTMAQIAILQASRTIIGENAERSPEPSPKLSAGSSLLLEIARMEKKDELSPLLISPADQESATVRAAELVKSRLAELKEQLASSQKAETEALTESQAMKVSMEKLKVRLENLLRQVVSERSAANQAEQRKQEAIMEAQIAVSELDKERETLAKEKAQTVEQIRGLQGQLADMQKELMDATGRVGELEKMMESERESARETIKLMETEAQSQEERLEQVIASLRLKIEQAAALYKKELEEALLEHQAEIDEKEEEHQAEIQKMEDKFRATLGSIEVSREAGEAALHLQSAMQQNEKLSEELSSAQDCMSRMSEELEVLNNKVYEDRMKREAQVEEELSILRSAQAHVDRMAAEKLSLIQQKSLLQRAILVTLTLALAGPITVLTMMTSGNVSQVDALEVKAMQPMIHMIDPTFHERKNEHLNPPTHPLESPNVSAKPALESP